MDKRADVKPGVTPPPEPGQKTAAIGDLEKSVQKTAADAAEDAFKKKEQPCNRSS